MVSLDTSPSTESVYHATSRYIVVHKKDNRVLAGAPGTVVGISQGGVRQGPLPPSFILTIDGRMPKSIADLTRVPRLDARCTVDMFFRRKHRRATDVSWSFTGDTKLSMITDNPIMCRKGSSWVKDALATFNYYIFTAEVACSASYSETALLWYTVAHRLPSGEPVQFVLYPASYVPGKGVSQVIGWLNDVSPEFGTPDW